MCCIPQYQMNRLFSMTQMHTGSRKTREGIHMNWTSVSIIDYDLYTMVRKMDKQRPDKKETTV